MRVLTTCIQAALACLTTSSAIAGDFATLDTIGFSPDGRVFAFEQHGTRDGSGFPYAEIFFLDLDDDRFLAPSPVRISLEAEDADVASARTQARAEAAPLFKAHRPEEHPGLVAADNPITEASADPHALSFQPRAFEPWPDEPVRLALERVPMNGGAACEDLGEETAGYRLVRLGSKPGEPAKLLHADKTLPDSRNCPLDYRLSRVVVHEGADGSRRAVAIIGVKSRGFEGPDLRFVANPVPLD